jgi:hypothetical protein
MHYLRELKYTATIWDVVFVDTQELVLADNVSIERRLWHTMNLACLHVVNS